MTINLLTWILLSIGFLLGLIAGYFLRKIIKARQINSAEIKAENLITVAKTKQKEILFQAKDRAIKIIEEAQTEEEERRKEMDHSQKRLEKRESLFDQKLLGLEDKHQKLQEKETHLEKIKLEINKIKEEQLDKLEKISELTSEQAKDTLLKIVEKNIKEDLFQKMRRTEEEGMEEIREKAKKILTLVIERCASSHAAEITTTIVNVPNEEMKGRIIGKEGRNIRALEQLLGVELIIDDTPNVILVSGFSPIRRHLAKKVLEKLILDGRIQPARIEETVEKIKEELSAEIKKIGEDATYEVGVAGLDPKLIQIIGRLKYRTSYGQNVLVHSIETAHLSALLASELGANISLARKGGFLHDIGKAVDQEVQGTHPEIGKELAKKFNLPEDILTIISTHHDDHPPILEAVIVKIADAISGARPGARKDTLENYMQRLEDLEAVANSFEGIEKSYAIQAGREIRIFVSPDKIDDWQAVKLAKNIATKIQEELKYPGEIKVTVIREKRITEYAK
ncbi:MAG: ribonuclease Y [Patescibacteria group bacterium]